MNEDWKLMRSGADALFTGIVIADSSFVASPFPPSELPIFGNDGRKVTFIVEHAWRLSARTQTDSVLVSVWSPHSNCAVGFERYERYLVVAVSLGNWARIIDSAQGTPRRTKLSAAEEQSLWTDRCMGSRPLADAREALRQLGPGVPIADSGQAPASRK